MWVNVWEHYLPLAEETQFYSLSSFDLDKLTNYLTETTAKLLRMSTMSQKHHILLLMMKTSIWCGRGEKKDGEGKVTTILVILAFVLKARRIL